MKASVAVLAGDGIGPEVIAEGLRCLRTIAGLFGHEFELAELPFGGAAIESHADPLPERTLSVFSFSKVESMFPHRSPILKSADDSGLNPTIAVHTPSARAHLRRLGGQAPRTCAPCFLET